LSKSERLTAEDWLECGLQTLARHGFDSLRAAPLAILLGVSRGSFYWHFTDVPAFHTAILDRWHSHATGKIIAEIEASHAGRDRLEALLQRVFQADLRLESAVRAWAFSSAEVRAKVEIVDRHRLDYIETLLADMGHAKPLAQAKALLLYWSFLGFVLSDQQQPRDRVALVLDDLLALSTATDQSNNSRPI